MSCVVSSARLCNADWPHEGWQSADRWRFKQSSACFPWAPCDSQIRCPSQVHLQGAVEEPGGSYVEHSHWSRCSRWPDPSLTSTPPPHFCHWTCRTSKSSRVCGSQLVVESHNPHCFSFSWKSKPKFIPQHSTLFHKNKIAWPLSIISPKLLLKWLHWIVCPAK